MASQDYREVLYSNYYSTHLGKNITDLNLFLDQNAKQLDKEFLHLLPNSKNSFILEIGCGCGPFLHMLSKNNYTNFIGLDISEDQVRAAHSVGINKVYKSDGFEYFKLNPSSEKADVIVAIDLIEHLTKNELVGFLLECKKHLKPNGIILMRTPNADTVIPGIFCNGDFTHETLFNSASASQVLLACGYTEVTITGGIMEANGIKKILQKIAEKIVLLKVKFILFATARSSKNYILSPNLVIKAKA